MFPRSRPPAIFILILAALFSGAANELCASELASLSLPAPGSYKLDRILRAPFSLVYDGTGFPHLLSSYTTGRITLLTFFYSECSDPQGCPLAWNAFEAMRKKIKDSPELHGRVRLVSFSFDPRHDRPNILDVFTQSYKDDRDIVPWEFIGSWSGALLDRTLSAFGQDVLVDQGAAKVGVNTIDHILKVFLIDRDGWVREIYTTAFLDPDIILGDIKTLQIEEEKSHLDR
jgi:protein SCO1